MMVDFYFRAPDREAMLEYLHAAGLAAENDDGKLEVSSGHGFAVADIGDESQMAEGAAPGYYFNVRYVDGRMCPDELLPLLIEPTPYAPKYRFA